MKNRVFRTARAGLLPMLLLTIFAGLPAVKAQDRSQAVRMEVYEAVKKGIVDVTLVATDTGVTAKCHRKTAEPLILLFKQASNGLVQFGIEDLRKAKGFSVTQIEGEQMFAVESDEVAGQWGFLIHPEKDETAVDLVASDTATVVLAGPCGLLESFSPFGGPQKNPRAVKQGKFGARRNDKDKLELIWGPTTAYCSETK